MALKSMSHAKLPCFSQMTCAWNTLQWTVSGYEDTLDHYRVFISTDGQHLMPLTTMAVGSRSLNLCSYTLAQRSYVLFVQAMGRPTIRNRMSRAVAYTPHCSAGTASVNLGASPASLRVSAGKSALSLNCAAIRAIEGESSFRFGLQPGQSLGVSGNFFRKARQNIARSRQPCRTSPCPAHG